MTDRLIYHPSNLLSELLDQPITVIIAEARFDGVLRNFNQDEMTVEQEGTLFVINRRAIDMWYAGDANDDTND